MKIADRQIGPGNPCFVVAEVSANHHQKYDEAVEIVKAAHTAGADAVKLQTYTPDTMTIDSNKEWFLVGGKDNPESWKGRTLYELYQTAYTPWEWQPELKKIAEKLGLILFSTPFDGTAVDFLEKMEVPCHKVASYELTDIPLLRKIAQTGKPVIISTGFASLEEIAEAVQTLRENGTKDLAVLHCVTAYSDKPNLAVMNLRTIGDIQRRFGSVAGFSDNNAGIDAPLMAAVAGASIIEKHFILNRADGGPDAKFSLEPAELKEMAARIRAYEKYGRTRFSPEEMEKAMGRVHYGPASAAEEYNKRFRRSIFAVKDIKKGEKFTSENVRVIRPAFGLAPKFLNAVLGRYAASDIERGTPLTRELAAEL